MKFVYQIPVIALMLLISCTTTSQTPAEVVQLSPTAFKQQSLNTKAVIVDVRTPEEFAAGHLDGAINVDYRGGDFAQQLKSWDKNKKYYLYCASGNRSSKAAALLQESGFRHIFDLGAYKSLQEAGLPTEEGVK